MTGQEIIRRMRVTDDPVGDLIADMRRDPDIPVFHNIEHVRGYLWEKQACSEAVDCVPGMWSRYRKLRGKQPPKTS